MIRSGGRLLAAVAVLAMAIIGLGSTAGSAFAAATINGGGSTFAALEMGQWDADYGGPPYNQGINYVSSGSTAGRQNYANGTYQYGASDIVYNVGEDLALANTVQTTRPFKYVTVSAGGLGFMYNLTINGQQVTDLQLSRDDVCQVFTGEVTLWSQLATTTPGDGFLSVLAGTPQDKITAVTRSDGAGESYVLSQYCQAVDPGDWAIFQAWVVQNELQISYDDPNMAAGNPVSYWPGTLYKDDSQTAQGTGAEGVADYVTNPSTGAGSITYNFAGYAKVRNYPVASVENAANPPQFTQPTPNNAQTALSYAAGNALGTFTLDFTGSAANAYFPSTYSYVLAPTTLDPTDSATLSGFLCYVVGGGQNDATLLDYAPLSAQVTALSVAAIQTMPGAPAASSCGVGGPAPQIQLQAPTVAPPPSQTLPPATTTTVAPTATTVAPTATVTTLAPTTTVSKSPGQTLTPTHSAVGGETTTTSGSGTSTPTTSGGSATTVAGEVTTPTTECLAATTTTAGASSTTGASPTAVNGVAPGSTPPAAAATPTAATTPTTLCAPSPVAVASPGRKGPGGTTAVTYGGAFHPGARSSGSPALATQDAVARPGPTNSQALWWLFIGAASCAVITVVIGAKKRVEA